MKSGRQKRRIQSRHLTGRSSNRIASSSSKLFAWEMQISFRWQYGHPLYPILSTLLPRRRGKTGAALAIEANLAPGIAVRQLWFVNGDVNDFCRFLRKTEIGN
jgi:hypothetical protein